VSALDFGYLHRGSGDGAASPESSKFELDTSGSGYHGRVTEDATVVSVTPQIRVDPSTTDQMVCGFAIINHRKHHDDIPFEISVLSQEEGTGELRARRRLNCEDKKSYQFDVQAISCSGSYSDSVGVHVSVEDVNEYPPEWEGGASSVRVEIEEGQLLDHLIQVQAQDQDCSSKYGDVCGYHILQSDQQPFVISKEGVIGNTRPLNYSVSHSYVLSVVAHDCGGKESRPLLITVEVKHACNTGWSGLASQVSYIPSTGPQSLYQNAAFSLCPESSCPVKSIQTLVLLETSHIGKGCDRDTYSLASQRQLCGADGNSIDLLPGPESKASWVQNMIRDRGQSADSSIVMLTGSSGYDIPTQEVFEALPDPFHRLSKFTFSTWMRHRPREEVDKHRKEHVLCQADDHRKNRHHMALFVRNCKLVLLLRREYQQGEENVFRPAEWRWKLPQVCDDSWHHYSLSVDFPSVTLHVDGEEWIPRVGNNTSATDTTPSGDEIYNNNKSDDQESKGGHHHHHHIVDNPEIIDDWPIHPATDIKTKLTIGACWQGSETSYRHHFKGYLAGMSFLPNSNENPEVLKCLHQCSESLQIPSASQLAPGMQMVINNRGSMVTVSGKDPDEMARLVEGVAYLNTREYPVPGRRITRIETRLDCLDGKTIHLESRRVDVDVLPVPEPTIDISGTEDVSREYEDFRLGVRVFADIRISKTTGGGGGGAEFGGEPVNSVENRLDRCTVSVSPPLNPDHEALGVPDDLLKSLPSVTGSVTAQGAEFSGPEMIYNYERLLRQVTYTNAKPAYYLNRQFKMSCSELNGRFVSNEYLQTLTVIHPAPPAEDPTSTSSEFNNGDTSMEQQQDFSVQPQPKVLHRRVDVHGVQQSDYTSVDTPVGSGGRRDFLMGINENQTNVTTMVAVVCTAFVVVFLALGIVRFRAAQRRSTREDLQAEIEMAWDDSALNITVNPMEQDSEKLPPGAGSGHGSVSSLSSSKLLARSSLSCDKNGARVTSMLETQPDDDDEDDDDGEDVFSSTDDDYDSDEDDDDLDDLDEDDDSCEEDEEDDHERRGRVNIREVAQHQQLQHQNLNKTTSTASESGRRLEWDDHDI